MEDCYAKDFGFLMLVESSHYINPFSYDDVFD